MLPSYLDELEQAVWRIASRIMGQHALLPGTIHREIRDLSDIYNAGLPPAGRPRYEMARLLFFTIADLPKVLFPLDELVGAEQLPADAPLRVLDIGAGYGAMTMGLIGQLDPPESSRPIQIDAVDMDSRALDSFELLFDECRQRTGHGANVTLDLATGDLTRDVRLRRSSYDLIIAGNVLNEISVELQLPVANRLLEALSPDGHLILLEPALRKTSRRLLALRDRLVNDAGARVFAPCTRQGPCPALTDPRDWCHERRNFRAPPRLRSLAAATGLRRRDLKWSYLTLNRHGATVHGGRQDAWRVVSAPIKSKGKLEHYLCGPEGRVRATRLNRDRSRSNEPFGQMDRGRLVWFEDLDAASCRVGSDTRVVVEDPAEPMARTR